MKKFSKIFLSLVLALSAVGCGNTQTMSTTTTLKDGTYTATATGIHEGLEVEVKIAEGKITDVSVVNHNETSGICEPAIERIPVAIVENQSVNIDAVSGASNTSRGILDAVKDIIVQAGGKVEDFSKEIETVAKEDIIINTDFVVVGGGASGSMAAVSALQKGVDVVVLEKGTSLGGVGKIAYGMFAVETDFQKEAGVNLTSEEIFDRMIDYSNYRVNGKLIKTLIEESSETVDYVQDNFGWTINLANMNEYNPLPDEYHRIEERNDERWSLVTNKIEELGGKIYYETTGEKLIYKDDKVVGVEAVQADGTKVIVNAKAVVLATGGAAGNNEMVEERIGIKDYFLRGSSLSTGDGIVMAEQIGAKTSKELAAETAEIVDNPKANYNLKDGTRFSYLGGIGLMTVDAEGSRFFDEKRYLEEPLGEGGGAMAYEGNFYTILTQKQLDAYAEKGVYGIIPGSVWVPPFYSNKIYGDISAALEEGIQKNYIFKGDTIEDLANTLKMGSLVREVDNYNEYCKNGLDEDFGKDKELLIPIEGEGPYYAFEFTNAIFCTLGGVYTNENFEARNTDGRIIPGLYATGVDNGSMFTDTYWDVEGITLSFSLSSGRLAGENAAEYVLANK